ncbi:MAG: response regulator transcription factor [Magnetospirillum sp.]
MSAPVILFVDDEPNVLSGIRRGLHKMEGHWTMLYASNGRQALDLLLTHEVAVVVTDIAMPVMDGETLIRRLYEDYPHIAVVVLSGYWSPEMATRRAGGMVTYLSKPITVMTLATTLHHVLQDVRLADPKEVLLSTAQTVSAD